MILIHKTTLFDVNIDIDPKSFGVIRPCFNFEVQEQADGHFFVKLKAKGCEKARKAEPTFKIEVQDVSILIPDCPRFLGA